MTSTISTVPLNKLSLSPRNVRKTNGEEDIAGLAQSIASKGLLQNLVVSPAGGSAKGMFEVDAGGRRLRALQLLAERKQLAKNWPVPVHVIAADAATEASLAENLQKIAMNPADEVEAFATIVAGYEANGMASLAERAANCARRFGVTERYVRQRLALAALAPEILDALRTGTITLAAATAYASHPDHAEQLKVFKAHEKRTGSYGKHEPQGIKSSLQGRLYAADHQLARYVGLDAYRAAGGRVEADLFFAEDEREMLVDPGLLEKLAVEKGEREAQQRAQAEGWLDAVLKPITGGYWNQADPPKGYARRYGGPEHVAEADRAEGLAYFQISAEGQLRPVDDYHFEKLPEPKEGEKPAPGHAETQAQYEARWRAKERSRQIRWRAAKLAAPKVEGIPLHGHAFWPADLDYDVEPIVEDEEKGTVRVALIVIIPVAEIEAQLEEAERRYEFELQELREEQEALAAEEAGGGGPEEFEEEAPEQDPRVNDAASAEPERV